MKLFLKDKNDSRYTVYACCSNCKKLVKKYTFDTNLGGPKRSETAKIVDTVKNRMIKTEMLYCYRCGTKNFEEG